VISTNQNKAQLDYTEEELKAVERILTKPVFVSFSEETLRVRRNLLSVAFIVLFYKLSRLEISNEGFSFLGIKFANEPSKEFLDITLLCLLIYHLIHFVWQSIDAWNECKLRFTGTNALFMKNDDNYASDYDFTDEPRQSSLAVQEELLKIKEEHKSFANAVNSKRTLVSLKRFEKFCKYFSYSQILRWYILEFGLPVMIALIAICLAFCSYLLEPVAKNAIIDTNIVLNFPCLQTPHCRHGIML